ncbi:diguanylate cyclase [Neobacillus niacini]|uniref:diguanylate cyclase n=1 Tax=Neobacillus niacini TaxID=86668 RepID=UPI001C8E271D|nr:diguanylate cyclase [Neobacillus niacini]MBY0149064.1 diguanylate cyclase [Neobacillus niacini]
MDIKNISTKQNPNKYQEIIDVKNAVIFQLDINMNFTSLNAEWINLTSYTVEETLGTNFTKYVKGEDEIVLQQHFDILVEGRRDGIVLEIGVVSKQGVAADAHLFLRADLDVNQHIISFSGTLTCLSSRRPNVAAFMENESNYRFITENMSDMVAVLAEDGLVLYASPSHAAILGRNLDDYIGSYPITHIHPDDWERIFHFFHEMIAEWRAAEIEYRCMHNNGEWLYLEMRGTPIKGPDGKIQVISVSRDITLRKKAEEELRQTTMKLKTLIASLPYGVKAEDENGNTTLYNDSYLNLFTFKPRGNENEEEYQQQLMSDARDIIQNFDSYQLKKKEIAESHQLCRAEKVQLKDGRMIEMDAVPMEENGRFDGYLWIYRDVTEEKKAEQKLQEANQLFQKLSMVDGLTGIANRRCFDDTLEKTWGQLTAHSELLSLMLIDIDFFKAFNDLYGHQAGDSCLQSIGGILKELPLEPDGLAARYGGEEFVVLLPGRNVDQAVEVARSIQETVKQAHIPHKGSSISERITLSIGISTMKVTNSHQHASLIMEADRALYQAKDNGRNRIKVYHC